MVLAHYCPRACRAIPIWRKINPADAPIMVFAMTSSTRSRGEIYDIASTVVAQKLSQVRGVGQVNVGGGSLPAVRVELDPIALAHAGLSPEQVRTAIVSADVDRPKGSIEDATNHWQILANDQARTAADYLPTVISWRDGAAVRLADVATVTDSVQDTRNAGLANGQSAILLILTRQPNANIVETVARVRAALPQIRASIPATVNLDVMVDRTPTIRASLREVERTLLIAILLVVLVTYAFLGDWRSALVSIVAVPVSLLGTCTVMYLCDYSLDTLSLMALTVATGFVVDDAVVVLENIKRHVEAGLAPVEAALRGAREVGFTVVAMSTSLVAVFIPILFMPGLTGRLFREFAVTLATAIGVSLVVSLTTTPMLASQLLKPRSGSQRRGFARWAERRFQALRENYRRALEWSLDHGRLIGLVLLVTVALNVALYIFIPKSFLPQQDTGRLIGNIQGDQSLSFQAMSQKLQKFVAVVRSDPAVQNVVAFTGGGQRNGANMFVALKPVAERKVPADVVIARLRGRLSHEPGAALFLQAAQDINAGGRAGNAQYQYTLQADALADLRTWGPRVRAAMAALPEIADVNTDQQDKGLQTTLTIDRDAAARLGISVASIDAVLYDWFGQRQVATIYNPLNQYHVVMEAAPRFLETPGSLDRVMFTGPSGAQIPLGAVARLRTDQRSTGRQPPGAICRHDDLLQSPTRGIHVTSHRCHRQGGRGTRHAQQRARQLPGQREAVPVFARQRAAPDRRRHHGDVSRAGHIVREPTAPTDHPVHPALGRCWRAAGAAGAALRFHSDRADRSHAADRPGQEERHHDDRRRRRGRARSGAGSAPGHTRGVQASLQAHPDDQCRRHGRRAAAGSRAR